MQQFFRIAKIVLINSFPIIGLIWFDWTLFEIALVYILETAAILLVFFFERIFINKKTRYPIFFGLIQLVFLIPPLAGILYTYTFFALMASGYTPPEKPKGALISELNERLLDMDLIWIFVLLFFIEMVSYIHKWITKPDFESKSYIRMLRRMLFTHLVLISGMVVVLFLPNKFIGGMIFFIGLKVVLDFMVEDKKFLQKLLRKLKKEEKTDPKG